MFRRARTRAKIILMHMSIIILNTKAQHEWDEETWDLYWQANELISRLERELCSN